MSADHCPSDAQLLAFRRGSLAEPLAGEVYDHLRRCTMCQARSQQADTERNAVPVGQAAFSATGPSGGDAPTLVPPVGGPPLAFPVTQGRPLPTEYSFLGPAQQPGEIGRLGNYRVLRLLGQGGMGYVFHAEDLSLGRPVALKVMKPELGGEADSGQRFLREARLMAALKHDHLVTVYQVGQENGVVYLAMELLEGESLLDRIKRGGRFEPSQIVRLAREMAAALATIDRQGLIHRDLKPGNIWLEAPSDRVKILDFGLARSLQEDTHLTQTGVVVGTPSFMSPEQASGLPLDGRSDLFSLGVVLYCMCTGTEPFRGPNVTAVLTALAVDTPRPVGELNAAIPSPLADLVMQLLNKKPEQRPPSAEAVTERLQQLEGTAPIPMAVPIALPSWLPLWLAKLSRRQQIIGLAVVLGIVILTIGISAGRGRPNRSTSGTGVKSSQPEAQTVYLKSLTPIASVNWPTHRTPDGDIFPSPYHVISVNGKVSPNGIGTHPAPDGPASVSYSLGRQYKTFRAEVSLNDSSLGTDTPITFTVYGDGKVLWKSKPLETPQDAQECKISVKGVEILKLEASGRGHVHGAHGVWIEPMLTR